MLKQLDGLSVPTGSVFDSPYQKDAGAQMFLRLCVFSSSARGSHEPYNTERKVKRRNLFAQPCPNHNPSA